MPAYVGVVALDTWHVCLMGLFLDIRSLVLECFQDEGYHQLVRR